ncbi:unnamed protein product [Adineta ricciae]|uniref:Uncharacterized protein n=1 Tax=Adineta ricciae TaxID=249248 RepID=A0A815VTX3_ADIRI|nr:unnamed protein product [Adineta ricciae]
MKLSPATASITGCCRFEKRDRSYGVLLDSQERTITGYGSVAEYINEKLDCTSSIVSVLSTTFGNSIGQNTNNRKKRQIRSVTLAVFLDAPNPNRNRGFDLGSMRIRLDSIPAGLNSCGFGFANPMFDRSHIQSVLGSAAFSLNIETTTGIVSVLAQFCSVGQVVSGKKNKLNGKGTRQIYSCLLVYLFITLFCVAISLISLSSIFSFEIRVESC